MLNNWVFEIGFVLLMISCLIWLFVVRMQLNTFKTKSHLQPLKRLLLVSVILLILAHIPLMIVYANTVWFHDNAIWLVYFAVLANAISAALMAVVLYAVYKFPGDEL
jgi:hypothetical protein